MQRLGSRECKLPQLGEFVIPTVHNIKSIERALAVAAGRYVTGEKIDTELEWAVGRVVRAFDPASPARRIRRQGLLTHSIHKLCRERRSYSILAHSRFETA